MSGFFGASSAATGGCCGKPVGCAIQSQGCVHKVEKRAWQQTVAALPACAACGMCETATSHVIAADSGWSNGEGMTPHPFDGPTHKEQP